MRKHSRMLRYIYKGGYMQEVIIINLDELEAEAESFVAGVSSH